MLLRSILISFALASSICHPSLQANAKLLRGEIPIDRQLAAGHNGDILLQNQESGLYFYIDADGSTYRTCLDTECDEPNIDLRWRVQGTTCPSDNAEQCYTLQHIQSGRYLDGLNPGSTIWRLREEGCQVLDLGVQACANQLFVDQLPNYVVRTSRGHVVWSPLTDGDIVYEFNDQWNFIPAPKFYCPKPTYNPNIGPRPFPDQNVLNNPVRLQNVVSGQQLAVSDGEHGHLSEHVYAITETQQSWSDIPGEFGSVPPLHVLFHLEEVPCPRPTVCSQAGSKGKIPTTPCYTITTATGDNPRRLFATQAPSNDGQETDGVGAIFDFFFVEQHHKWQFIQADCGADVACYYLVNAENGRRLLANAGEFFNSLGATLDSYAFRGGNQRWVMLSEEGGN